MKMQCQETVMQCQEKIAFPKEEARRHNSCRPCVSDCSQECNDSFARVYKAAGMRKVVWSGEEWAAADERRRRVHADATLAPQPPTWPALYSPPSICRCLTALHAHDSIIKCHHHALSNTSRKRNVCRGHASSCPCVTACHLARWRCWAWRCQRSLTALAATSATLKI
jgi:hypothetical protein